MLKKKVFLKWKNYFLVFQNKSLNPLHITQPENLPEAGIQRWDSASAEFRSPYGEPGQLHK